MSRRPEDATVRFPADPTFRRLGRVTISGLGLRLGLDVATVEHLRTAIDCVLEAFGDAGRIELAAHWDDDGLRCRVRCDGGRSLAETDRLRDDLVALVGDAEVDTDEVTLVVPL